MEIDGDVFLVVLMESPRRNKGTFYRAKIEANVIFDEPFSVSALSYDECLQELQSVYPYYREIRIARRAKTEGET